ncbi:hypothetical protein L202_02186 [Cryptococcus amylolentus CBS 6039]|uniref:Transmembrane protein n=1 Tax=Cryptococcus amylolentus CBS 6039 TaxID=1295533 RepID=A0A1E3HZR8_9TREE|nr:hypothetical protein L202_02186 [Cryptococcus amylolentus CBS 6039]ODN81822.1 hypothetical protein L202_02186 [Cryptococcus amylolentus CBS 6039]
MRTLALYTIVLAPFLAICLAFGIPDNTTSIINIATRDEGAHHISPGAIAGRSLSLDHLPPSDHLLGVVVGCLALTTMFSCCMWRRNRWQPPSVSRKSYPASPTLSPYLPRYRESQYNYPQYHYKPSAPPQYNYSSLPPTVALPPAVYLPVAEAGSGYYAPRSSGRYSPPPPNYGNGRKTVRFGEVGVRRY